MLVFVPSRVSSLARQRVNVPSQWLCRRCSQALHDRATQRRVQSVPVRPSLARHFTGSSAPQKKAGKRARDTASSDSSPPGPAAAPNTATDDAYDFTGLESAILKAVERLAHRLSELRAGGRFNTDLLESLRVRIPGEKDHKSDGGGSPSSSARLGDLAQVIIRGGRKVNIVVGEEAHVKPVAAAILASPHSLNPQGPSSPDAPTTLTLHLPPPTGESRRVALESAVKFAEDAGAAVKVARQAHHKKLRALELARKVRPDDLQRAHKQMEEVVKKGQEEVKRITDGAKSVLESV